MTKVVILKRNNKIFEVECDGHTNYGEKGEDIVCASLSSIVQTAVLGLLMIVMVAICGLMPWIVMFGGKRK